ncbi:nuclear transport factor 2 family protein [Kistimonas asteriae]|uniref:nuclear transport factor 2 family protein n=1 Tax=Kistimonas asteriae TaxID=517724 RepID=UPI001BAD9417|nr:nuclear transport factor 2 family protein [Kistimonas asteriae]
MDTTQQNAAVLAAVNVASTEWMAAFNRADAAGCAAHYEASAIMHARPFGTYTGTTDIQAFWKKLMDDGLADVAYSNTQIEVLDTQSAVLTADWTMNKAQGVIHRELWVLQSDGTAKLREDDFEAQ